MNFSIPQTPVLVCMCVCVCVTSHASPLGEGGGGGGRTVDVLGGRGRVDAAVAAGGRAVTLTTLKLRRQDGGPSQITAGNDLSGTTVSGADVKIWTGPEP